MQAREHYGKEVICVVGGVNLTMIYLEDFGEHSARCIDLIGTPYQVLRSSRMMKPTGRRYSAAQIARITGEVDQNVKASA